MPGNNTKLVIVLGIPIAAVVLIIIGVAIASPWLRLTPPQRSVYAALDREFSELGIPWEPLKWSKTERTKSRFGDRWQSSLCVRLRYRISKDLPWTIEIRECFFDPRTYEYRGQRQFPVQYWPGDAD